MIAAGEEELICDFAETYHLYGLESVPVELAEILAAGLPPDSRLMRKLSGRQASDIVILLAMAVDTLNLLLWSKTKDAQHRRNRPESIAARLTEKPQKAGKVDSFQSGVAFKVAWRRATRQ